MSRSDGLVLVLLFFVLLLPVVSCDSDRVVNLDRFDIQVIDSIFFSKRDSITKLADTLCDQQYPIILSSAIDSIKAVRLQEIESILSRR